MPDSKKTIRRFYGSIGVQLVAVGNWFHAITNTEGNLKTVLCCVSAAIAIVAVIVSRSFSKSIANVSDPLVNKRKIGMVFLITTYFVPPLVYMVFKIRQIPADEIMNVWGPCMLAICMVGVFSAAPLLRSKRSAADDDENGGQDDSEPPRRSFRNDLRDAGFQIAIFLVFAVYMAISLFERMPMAN